MYEYFAINVFVRVFFFLFKMNIHLVIFAPAIATRDAYELCTRQYICLSGLIFCCIFSIFWFHNFSWPNFCQLYIIFRFDFVVRGFENRAPHSNPLLSRPHKHNSMKWEEINWAKRDKYFQLKIQSTKEKSPNWNGYSWTSLLTIIIRRFNSLIFSWTSPRTHETFLWHYPQRPNFRLLFIVAWNE